MGFSSETKLAAAKRQNGRCGLCGTSDWRNANFEYHHIISRFASNDDSLENCVMLCYDCHREEAHIDSNTRGLVLAREEFRYFNG
jgi:5-methylcytosine-specific restriction endonuclease McrA